MATLDDPPTLPLFSAANNIKRCNNNYVNNNNNIQSVQAPNPFYSPTGFFLLYPGMFNQNYNNFANNLTHNCYRRYFANLLQNNCQRLAPGR